MSFNVALPRQRGKTTWAIKMAAKHDAYMVVPFERDVLRVTKMAERMGLNIRHPLTIHEFLFRPRLEGMRDDIGYVFDDADLLIQAIARPRIVHGITMTGTGASTATTQYTESHDLPETT